MVSHLKCLAESFLEEGELLPVGGKCLECQTYLVWQDLIRLLYANSWLEEKRNGIFSSQISETSEEEEDHSFTENSKDSEDEEENKKVRSKSSPPKRNLPSQTENERKRYKPQVLYRSNSKENIENHLTNQIENHNLDESNNNSFLPTYK